MNQIKKWTTDHSSHIVTYGILLLTAIVLLLYEFGVCNNARILSGSALHFSIFRAIVYFAILVAIFFFRKKILGYIEECGCLNRIKWIMAALFAVSSAIILVLFYYYKHLKQLPVRPIDYCSLAILMLLALMGLLLIGKQTEKNFLVIGLTLLIVFPFITPILNGIDEPAHFTEAYTLSTGRLLHYTLNSFVPAAYNSVPANTIFKDFFDHFQTSVDYANHSASTATGYPFYFYLPSAIGLFIGRHLHFDIVSEFLIGRVFNCVFYIVCGYFILKLMPYYKNILAVIMLSPYLGLLASYYSTDGIGNLIIFAFIAYCFYLKHKKIELHIKQYILLAIMAILVLTVKSAAYCGVLLFLFILPAKNLFKKERLIKFFRIFIPVAVVCGAVGLVALAYYKMPLGMGDQRGAILFGGKVDEALQIRYMIQHPFSTLYVFSMYCIDHLFESSWWVYIVEPFFFKNGKMIFLPMLFLWGIVAATDYNDGIPDKKQAFKEKSFMLVSFLTSFFICGLFLYITFNAIGATYINGVQARYMFPVLPTFLMIFNSKNIKNNIHNYNQLIGCASLVLIFIAQVMIV